MISALAIIAWFMFATAYAIHSIHKIGAEVVNDSGFSPLPDSDVEWNHLGTDDSWLAVSA